MQEVYRGHVIRLSRTSVWSAVLTEVATGAMLPTKATALEIEGYAVALIRARKLVDMYATADVAAQSDAA